MCVLLSIIPSLFTRSAFTYSKTNAPRISRYEKVLGASRTYVRNEWKNHVYLGGIILLYGRVCTCVLAESHKGKDSINLDDISFAFFGFETIGREGGRGEGGIRKV